MRIRLALTLVFALLANTALAQVTIPYTNFVSGQIIASGESNANFSVLADQVLNRTGGTITGPITLDADITLDGVDLADFFGASGQVRATVSGTDAVVAYGPSGETNTGLYLPATGQLAASLAGTQRLLLNSSGLTVFGVNSINSSGKIPALTSTYFGSTDAGNIQFSEDSFADGSVLARLPSNETITGAWSFADQLTVGPTWNSGATTFRGLDINVTNTASAAASMLVDWRVGSSTVASVNVAGKFVPTSLQITNGAVSGAILVADADGVGTWTDLTNSVPAGMLAFFEAACPSGWTQRMVYNNKFVRGGATYSETGGGSDGPHLHSVDPPSTSSAADGSHTHSVDFVSTGSSTDGSHTHGFGGSFTVPSDGSHSHNVSTSASSASGGGSLSVEEGVDGAAASAHTHSWSGSTSSSSDGAHTHGSSYPLTTSEGSHSHTVDLGSTGTSSDGSHTHTTDIASFSSGTQAALPAYVQVIVCKKD
jgi:hypothetical protein